MPNRSASKAKRSRGAELVELKMVEKWNGVAPQVVGSGTNILLPLGKPQ